jgi:hypothetical protein
MSCIQHLAKLRGDNEIFFINDEAVLEETGSYKGYDFCVLFTERGFRCGYIALPSSYSILKHTSVDDFKILFNTSVHGGISFLGKPHLECLNDRDYDEIWIGFDTSHRYDEPDFDLCRKIFGENLFYSDEYINETRRINKNYTKFKIEVRTKEYMINECKRLIDQLIVMEK